MEQSTDYERRLARLEARQESTATREDVALLRASIDSLNATLTRYMSEAKEANLEPRVSTLEAMAKDNEERWSTVSKMLWIVIPFIVLALLGFLWAILTHSVTIVQ